MPVKAVAVKKTPEVKQEKVKKVVKTVDNSNLFTFFKLITLQGDVECPEAVFDVKDGTLDASVISSDRTLAMKGSVQGEFEAFGKIGIAYLPSLNKFFNTIGKNFSIEFDTNKMILKSDGSKLTTTIQNAEYIVNKLEDEKFTKIENTFKGGYSVKLTKEVIADFVSKFNTLEGEILKLSFTKSNLCVTIKNNTTGTTLETDYKLENDLDKEVSFELNQRFGSLFEALSKNIESSDVVWINIAKEKGIAVAINLNNKVFNLKYIIALLDRKEK